ncbi:MAG TPA: hypothetical protein DCF63_05685, partial [Planctomycetaceae bacterium]|nr:hypothetical protein [Planctomycetaceae bacterium]
AATARVLRDEGRQNFQSDWKPQSQTVVRNIVAAKKRTRFKSQSRYVVRVRDGKKARPRPEIVKGPRGGTVYVNAPFYWRFLEFGFHDPPGTFHQGTGFLRRSFQQ